MPACRGRFRGEQRRPDAERGVAIGLARLACVCSRSGTQRATAVASAWRGLETHEGFAATVALGARRPWVAVEDVLSAAMACLLRAGCVPISCLSCSAPLDSSGVIVVITFASTSPVVRQSLGLRPRSGWRSCGRGRRPRPHAGSIPARSTNAVTCGNGQASLPHENRAAVGRVVGPQLAGFGGGSACSLLAGQRAGEADARGRQSSWPRSRGGIARVVELGGVW